MSFANPAALWLLCLLPLLLLTQQRPPASRLAVATLHLWRQTDPLDPALSRRRRRIDRLVLLQAACLIALVVALAQPTIATRAVAVVIDTSLSMGANEGGASRLDAAIRRVVEVIDELPPWTRVRVFDAARPPDAETGRELSRRAAKARLAALTTTSTPDDIPATIERARHSGVSRIYVVSDRPAPADPGPSGRQIEWHTVGRPADNVAVTGLSLRRRDSGRVEILTEMRNYGTKEVQSVLRIARGAADLASTPVRIEAGRSATTLHDIADEPGVVTARLEAADALASDNERRLVVEPARPLRVELRGGGAFLARALEANASVLLVEDSPRDVVVCNSCEDLPADGAGVVLVSPAVEGRGDLAPLVRLQPGFAPAVRLDGLGVSPASNVSLPPGAVVVATAAGAPAVLTYSLGPRRIVELRFDPETSPLALTPAFPLLVDAAVSWVSEPWQPHTTVDAGEPVRWRVGADTGDVAVNDESGASVTASTIDGWFVLASTSRAGTFTMRSRETSRPIVVNPATAGESDLQRPSPPAGVTPAQPTVTAASVDPGAGLPLLLAIGLLAAEWRLRQGARGRRR